MNLSALFSNISYPLLAIISSIFAACANILARTLLQNLKSQETLGINFLLILTPLVLFSPLFYRFEASLYAMALLIGVSVIDTLANYFYFQTFEHNSASVATPILSLAPAYTFLFGWFVLDDVVPLSTLLMALCLVGIILLFSVDFSNIQQWRTATLQPSLLASLLFGVSAIPSKILLDTLGVMNAPTLYMFRAGFIVLFSLPLFGIQFHNISLKQYRVIFTRGLLVITQWVLLYIALSLGSAGVTMTLGNITPIFVFICSFLFLQEGFEWKKLMMCIAAIGLSLVIV